MTNLSRRLCGAFVASLLVLGPGPAHAGDAESESRRARAEALESLQSGDAPVRQRAAARLGSIGTMEDVPRLLGALRDDAGVVRAAAEQAVWAVWSRSGNDEVDRLFAEGVGEMQSGRLTRSAAIFSRIIELAPAFAEGWNKRATVLFLGGDLEGSLRDCDEVIRLNPVHFGALSGYGLIYTRLGKLELAIDYFERALAVNPNMPGVRQNIEVLRRELARRGYEET